LNIIYFNMKKFKVILICVFCLSLNTEAQFKYKTNAPMEISENGNGVFVTKDNQNSIVLNWTEAVSDGQFVMKYLELDPYGNRKNSIKTIPTTVGTQSHAESMPKIIKTAKGVVYAVFRIKAQNPKNRFGGHIYYTLSKDNGKTWVEKQKLVQIKNARSQSFYDVALLPDGEVGISWLDSRKISGDKEGSTLYFAKSKGSKGFVGQKPLVGSTCQCCRTELFVNSRSEIYVAFRNITKGSIRDMFQVNSSDNGLTFSLPKRIGKDNWKINGCPHTGPSLASDASKTAAVWFTGAISGSGIYFKKLSDEMTFLGKKKPLTSTGRHPQMAALPNGDFCVVYEDSYTVKEKVFERIVLHVVKNDGSEIKKIISESNTKNDHAVITITKEGKLLVSWVKREEGKSKNLYTVLDEI